MGDLVGAKGDGQVCTDRRPIQTTSVDLDAGRHIHGDHWTLREELEGLLGIGSQTGFAADAHNCIDHHVRALGLGRGYDLAPCSKEGRHARRVRDA